MLKYWQLASHGSENRACSLPADVPACQEQMAEPIQARLSSMLSKRLPQRMADLGMIQTTASTDAAVCRIWQTITVPGDEAGFLMYDC